MKRVTILSMIVIVGLLSSCTKEQRAKNWGGSYTYELPANQKLVDVTWKGDDTWVLYRPMTPNEKAVTYTYVQQKGQIMNLTGDGQIKFVESRSK